MTSHFSMYLCVCDTHLLKLKSRRSKTSTGPVLLRIVRGWPANRQNTAPVNAVPTKLSNTPCTDRQKHTRQAENTAKVVHLKAYLWESTTTAALIRFQPVCDGSCFFKSTFLPHSQIWKCLFRQTPVSNTNHWSFLT